MVGRAATRSPIATSTPRSIRSPTTTANYKSYLANAFSSLAPRFHVDQRSGLSDGQVQDREDPPRHCDRQHRLPVRVLFARHQPRQNALCTPNTPQGICQANIANPLVFVGPPGGLFSYAKTSPSTGIYVSSIIRQQGFSFGDNITLSPRWLVRVAASQDWTWTDSYSDTAATSYRKTQHSRRIREPGSEPVRQHHVQTARGHDDLRDLRRQHSGAGCRGGEQRQHVIVNASQALPAVSQQGGRDRLQAESAADQLLHRAVPGGPAVCELRDRGRGSGLRSSVRYGELRGFPESPATRSTTEPKR